MTKGEWLRTLSNRDLANEINEFVDLCIGCPLDALEWLEEEQRDLSKEDIDWKRNYCDDKRRRWGWHD